MKKVIFISALVGLCACSNDFEQVPESNQEKNNNVCEAHKIDQTQAFEIANLYFSETTTRSSAPLQMGYIVDEAMTRSGASGSDTLAYILNRGTNDGFVIVSSDDRVYPILGCSETGTFKYEKGDIVDTQFISRLGDYMEANKDNEARTVTPGAGNGCYISNPVITYSWNQRSPFNKYVIQEYPGCLAGYVDVATGMIMIHCKSAKFNYHGVNFYPKSIRQGLASASTRVVGGEEVGPKYTFDQASDFAARLLYWIGKDIHTRYSPTKSAGSTYDARTLLVNQGYDVKGAFKLYNEKDAVRSLLDNSILFMKGYDQSGAGYAWVIDGCGYCIRSQGQDPVNILVHCDWGLGGSNNGYYYGEVFTVGSTRYGNMFSLAIGIK